MSRMSRIMKSVGKKAVAPQPSVLVGEPEHQPQVIDDDLARLMAVWPHLPLDYKRTILTLVSVAERNVNGQ
jgi:hypothetical protein